MTRGRARAVVVGGGIAGLVAAYDLVRAGWTVDVHEAADRWGGKVWSSPVGDRVVDAGPDAFLARVEPGRRLCADLGLESELTSPVSPVPAYLARDGRLHPLPAGSMLGVPTDLDVLRRGGLISPEGIAAAETDRTAPATPIRTASPESPGGVIDDISVGAYCRARLGDEITDRLIDPLLGGINASDIDSLSLRAGAPLLADAADQGPSLIDELARLRPATGATLGTAEKAQPVFYGIPGGTARIVDTVLAALEDSGRARLHLRSPVSDLDAVTDGAGAEGAGAGDVPVIIGTPAFATADIVASVSPDAAALLEGIGYASVAQAVVELPRSAVGCELDASGILFPRVEGTMLTACTWLSTKWAHYRRPDSVLLRLSSGRFGDRRPADHDDASLIAALLDDLRTVVAVDGTPIATRVLRWDRAFPQYAPGHLGRVAAITDALAADAPNVRLVGAAYRGIGLPACIDDGRTAAQELLDG
ncbi:MAG: protoporphyrinogen oxidase [Actinomycetota bacterium]